MNCRSNYSLLRYHAIILSRYRLQTKKDRRTFFKFTTFYVTNRILELYVHVVVVWIHTHTHTHSRVSWYYIVCGLLFSAQPLSTSLPPSPNITISPCTSLSLFQVCVCVCVCVWRFFAFLPLYDISFPFAASTCSPLSPFSSPEPAAFSLTTRFRHC